ncbi:DUF3311 domain-containing protein [Brevibacterium sp. UCMA 11752]|uniref:DUF3311 domain-containing protein n=1 Tax=Brevibacterium sp. UCMA 11752 TaxID=2745946 RepID=UPI001F229B79|nr:DUF3311 domain-containing protein [Brevibacterium sp. UCMA 11752]MCF2586300.1 DUF3311 domain-containing protein [Brevibacterium sp. UCMA 11752]
MSGVHDSPPPSRPPRRRYSLLLLIIPVVGYLLTPFVANSIEPRIFGMPFILTYTIVVTILTWFFVWMAARGDHYYRGDKAEYVPADVAFGEDHPIGEAAETASADAASADGSEAEK